MTNSLFNIKGEDKNTGIAIPTQDKISELSLNQNGLWFLDHLIPNSTLYSIPWMCKLSGEVNLNELKNALSIVWERHDILRSKIIIANDKPFISCSNEMELPFCAVDLKSYKEEQIQDELNRRITLESKKPFNLSTDNLTRIYLYSYSDNEHVLFFNMHHIIFDGWSMEILLKDVATIYNALIESKKVELPKLEYSYFDFSTWHKQRLNGAEKSSYLRYWSEKLSGVEEGSQFPLDYTRPIKQSYPGEILTRKIPLELSNRLSELARSERSTLYMVLLSALKVLLHKYTSSSDIIIGSPMAGRTKKEFEAVIGYFVNLVVLRTTCNSDTNFKEILKDVKRTTLEAYAYQDLPLDILAKQLLPTRKTNSQPFVQTVFAYEDDATLGIRMNGLDLSPIEGLPTSTSKFDTTWTITNKGAFLELNVEYNTDLFKKESIVRLMDHYENLLQNILADPECVISKLEIMSKEEKATLNTGSVLILDTNLNPVPVGIPGELYINNISVDKMNNHSQYNPKFEEKLVENPFEKEMYLLKTGKAKWDSDGSIHILGISEIELGMEKEVINTNNSNENTDNLESITGKAIQVIWRDVLGVEELKATDNFFALGGHSLLAIQIMVRVKEIFGIDVPLRNLFEAQNIEEYIIAVESIVTSDINSENYWGD